jgi:LacI family transcriptional regulator
MAGEHLLRLGRTRIAHVTGPLRTEAVRDRAQGLEEALAAAGLELPPDRVLYGNWSEAWGHDAVATLLGSGQPLDAIFCGSDQIARGVVDALRDRGIRVPHDIAVVGFDNWEIIAAATRPPLTTIDMELHELGRHSSDRHASGPKYSRHCPAPVSPRSARILRRARSRRDLSLPQRKAFSLACPAVAT